MPATVLQIAIDRDIYTVFYSIVRYGYEPIRTNTNQYEPIRTSLRTIRFPLDSDRIFKITQGKGVLIDIMRLLMAPNGRKDSDVQTDRQ